MASTNLSTSVSLERLEPTASAGQIQGRSTERDLAEKRRRRAGAVKNGSDDELDGAESDKHELDSLA